jgi:hypothetical protein
MNANESPGSYATTSSQAASGAPASTPVAGNLPIRPQLNGSQTFPPFAPPPKDIPTYDPVLAHQVIEGHGSNTGGSEMNAFRKKVVRVFALVLFVIWIGIMVSLLSSRPKGSPFMPDVGNTSTGADILRDIGKEFFGLGS